MDYLLNKLAICLLGALLFFGPVALADRYVILKLDDAKPGLDGNLVQPGIEHVAYYLESKNLKTSFGIICNFLEDANPSSLEWIRKHAIENGGLIEFWHHGYNHAKAESVDGKTAWREFSQTPYEYQKEHFDKAQYLMKVKTGITFHTFGAPFNATDDTTRQILGDNSEIKVWFHGGRKGMTDKLVLGQPVLLEESVGYVSYDYFIQGYKAHPNENVLVLQGHPSSWNDVSFLDFTKIVELLNADGWHFVTPYEYYNLLQVRKGIDEDDSCRTRSHGGVPRVADVSGGDSKKLKVVN